MNYKYMKTGKIDVQGSIDIISTTTGTLSQDLTGSYDIDDIKTLLGDYINIDVIWNNETAEMGLRNIIFHPDNIDTTSIVIKKATSGFDSVKFNNLLKLLGFSDGSTVYTTDQTFDEFDTGWGLVVSPYMGGKIPLEFIVPLGRGLRCGYSTYTPLTIKRAGEDTISNVGEYSHSYRVRRGYTLTMRGTRVFIDLLDVVKRLYATPVKWYFPSGFHIPDTEALILLPHTGSADASIVYSTINVYSTEIAFLKGV